VFPITSITMLPDDAAAENDFICVRMIKLPVQVGESQ
jgi:hypothetical protein